MPKSILFTTSPRAASTNYWVPPRRGSPADRQCQTGAVVAGFRSPKRQEGDRVGALTVTCGNMKAIPDIDTWPPARQPDTESTAQ